jgi:YidC/Oxa1 family membrane protein insertase
MDRTSRIGLAVCLILLIGIQFSLEKLYPTPPPKPKPAVTATSPTETVPAPASMTSATPDATKVPVPAAPETAKFTDLENDAMKVTFTSVGAAITEIVLKQHRADNGGNVVLNEQSHSNILALAGWPGADEASFDSQAIPNGMAFSTTLPNGVKWQRTYTFGKSLESDTGMSGFLRVMFNKIARHLGQSQTKPLIYTLDVSDTLTNGGAVDITLPGYSLGVGRAVPIYNPVTKWEKQPTLSSLNSMYLGSGWLASKFHLTTINNFNPGAIPLIGIQTSAAVDQFSSKTVDLAPLRWIGVENQFFTVLLTPAEELPIEHGRFICLSLRDDRGYVVTKDPDIEAAANFAPVTVPAGKTVTLNYGLYAGPKDFNRLDALGANQGELMNYGLFAILIVPMLTVLHFWFLVFKNYGAAIILLTLMIKAITWPLQSIANHSGKKMQALAPKLKELQAKYKEQPEKLQTETFAMYKDYGVNPFGGCLPALIQMPVFFSLYFMLQNAVELRGQSFLWVHDLTRPDAVWTAPFLFFGFHPSLHPLPIMVTALTMVMMRMTPQIGDPAQAKIAQYMPLVFLVIFYNFAAALSLYYVINNCVSIIQIYRNLKKPLPELKRIPRKKSS